MKYLVYISLFVFLFSCGTKQEVFQRDFDVEYFNEVVIWSPSHVELAVDSLCGLQVAGNQELLDKLEVEVIDSTLHIKDGRGIKWDTPESNQIDLLISLPALRRLETKESCFISTIDTISTPEFGLILGAKTNEANIMINNETFYYWCGAVTGGKLTLSGSCEIVKLWNAGLLSVDAKNLNANDAIVENTSRGDVEVMATQKLDYLIDGHGDLHLYGNPGIVNELSEGVSTGQLIKH